MGFAAPTLPHGYMIKCFNCSHFSGNRRVNLCPIDGYNHLAFVKHNCIHFSSYLDNNEIKEDNTFIRFIKRILGKEEK